MKLGKKLGVTAVFLFLTAILIFSIYQGRQRHVFPVTRIDRFVPIPELYADYTGSYTWLDEGRIRVDWRRLDIHADASTTFFLVRGKLRGVDTDYYLLEMDGKRYLEKAEHIEPLIHALLALSRGNDPDDHEETVEASIAALPDDPAFLIELVKRFPR